MATLHYASGDNINAQGTFTPAQAGFNLADVSSVDQVNALPAGVKGLVWLDQGDGVTQSFIDSVKPFIGNPNVYGFFLKDEPDPTGQWNTLVTAANLKAESDWIHANVPGAKTFITMMNMGSSENPSFANTYTPANTHIDFFGIDPYPVRSDGTTVNYNMIDKAVAAAEAAGIPTSQIVPVFQTFGGGNWVDDSGGHYVMPTAAQEQQMLNHWAALVPNPAFDYAYAWGAQNGDQALGGSQELQNVFLQHNTSGGTTTGSASSSGSTPPVDTSGGSTATGSGSSHGSTPPADTSGGSTTTGSGSSHGSTPPADTSGGSTTTGSGSSHSSTPPADTSGGSTTTGSASDTGSSGHHHSSGQHHNLDVSHPTGGSASSSGGHHQASTPHAATVAVSTAADPTSDTGSSGHHYNAGQHHQLDFSQLAGGSASSSGGYLHVSTPHAATAAVSTAADPSSGIVADATLAPHLDLASLHTAHHADHQAWHW